MVFGGKVFWLNFFALNGLYINGIFLASFNVTCITTATSLSTS